MFEEIDIHGKVPAYVQIENHVRFAVASGRLKPGDQLPPAREVSEQLQINLNTVVNAYRDLQTMGIIYARRGRGAYVAKDAAAKCFEDCRRHIILHLHEIIAEAKSVGMSAQEVNRVCAACFMSDADPGGEVPERVLALAKAGETPADTATRPKR